ncbi:glycosyltransferase [Synechococcus sp. BA-120 BA3]|nr:glycosyltransferase [Synechococcus sp. BA-120 BA3]
MVIVSDFELSDQKTWHDEIEVLKAFAAQDFDEPFELIVMENPRFADAVPEILERIAPQTRVVFTDQTQSARLKDDGVRQCRGDLVAVIEADCLPNPAWLRTLVGVLREHPEVDVVSGRTWYGDQTPYRRCLNLLHRAFDDYGRPSPSSFISNNGALYRRAVLEAFPYPEAITPFLSARLRNRRLLEAGHTVFFHPEARMLHAIGGLPFLFDVHRNVGYSDIMQAPRGPTIGSILPVLLQRTKRETRDLRRLGDSYLKGFDRLLLPLFQLVGRCFETVGMVDALLRRPSIPHSAYR